MAKISQIPTVKMMEHHMTELHDKMHPQEFDHEVWWKSVIKFWLGIFLFMAFMAMVKYASACDPGKPDTTMEQIKVRGI